MESLTLVGRGPSIHDVRLPDQPILAISTGIFALDPHDDRVQHFCSLDKPKYFVHPLKTDVDIAWVNDPGVTHWPFWEREHLLKHVPENLHNPGYMRPDIPIEVVPEQWREQVLHDLVHNHISGYQEGWADFPGTVPHDIQVVQPPSFGPEGIIGLRCDECERQELHAIRHTVFFALQLGCRLGYKHFHLAGVDLLPDRYSIQRHLLKHWETLAEKEGVTWQRLEP